VKANKVVMKRADTLRLAADLFTNFGIPGKVLVCGLCGLLPRLGNRAATITIYCFGVCILLYVFVVDCFANIFINSVRGAVLAFLNPMIKDVTEF